jgi:hypothetical protein
MKNHLKAPENSWIEAAIEAASVMAWPPALTN